MGPLPFFFSLMRLVEWIKKLWYIYTVEYNWATKKKEI